MEFLLDKEDWKLISYNLGSILVIIGITFILPVLSAVYFGEYAHAAAFLLTLMVSVNIGLALRFFHAARPFAFKHAMIIAAMVWLIVPLVSSLPFIALGMSLADSYFESMSGWTTTGLTIIPDVEALPKSLLLFRSYTHWLGGIGIILLALTVLRLPKLGQKLYAAETRSENVKLNVFDTAKLIYGAYIVLTVAGIAALFLAGMPLFDAVNHSMSAIATGGFSVKNSSIAYYSSQLVNIVTIFLMFLGGTNIVVLYYVMRGRLGRLRNTETMAACVLIALFSALVVVFAQAGVIEALFSVVSTLTSTGYTVSDVSQWSDIAVFLLVILMYTGASSGSTTGSIKIWRFVMVLKDAYRETIKYMKPERAFLPIKFDGRLVEEEGVRKIKTFVLIYIIATIMFSVTLMAVGFSFKEAIFTAASAQGNIGLAISAPDQWFNMAEVTKIILIAAMWLGRLEILPALVLLRSLMPMRK